jgi:hypothetical protein
MMTIFFPLTQGCNMPRKKITDVRHKWGCYKDPMTGAVSSPLTPQYHQRITENSVT